MTREDVLKNAYGDILLLYEDGGWTWNLNCGYQTWGGDMIYNDPAQAVKDLDRFLETWTGPTK